MSDGSLADGKAGVDATLDGPAKRRQIRNIVERKRKEKIKYYINAIAKLLPTDRLEHKERNSTNSILEAAWGYMVDLREQNDKLLLERGTDVHNQEISRLKCLLSEAREDRDRMERMLQHCASLPAGFDPLTQWHKGSSTSGNSDGPAVAERACSARSSAPEKQASEPTSSAVGALPKATLLAAATASGVLLPTVAAGGLCNGASVSAAAAAATSAGKPLCIPPNLGQGLIITQSGQAIFLNEQGVAVAQGLIGGALPSLPGLVSRPDEAAAAVHGADGSNSVGSKSAAFDGELSASGASSLDSSTTAAAAGSSSPAAPATATTDGQSQTSRPGASHVQPPVSTAGIATQSGLALGAAAMSAMNAHPSLAGLASATRFGGTGAGTALAIHQQSGGLVAMAAGQATGGIVAVPGQSGQLPSAFLLPNGQIIPVVTQPQALQPVAPAQLAAAAAACVPLAADIQQPGNCCKAASVASSTPPLLFTTASGSASVTTTVTTGTISTSRATSMFQHPAATVTAAGAAAPAGSAAAAGSAGATGAGAITAAAGGSLMYVALPPAMSLQPPAQQQQQSLASVASCSSQQQQQAAAGSGGTQLLLDAGCFAGSGAEQLKAAAAAAAAGGQRLIMPKPANFANSAVHQYQQQPLPALPPSSASADGGPAAAKSKRKAKKATGSGGSVAPVAGAAPPGVPTGNAVSQQQHDLDTDILAKAAESIFSDNGGGSHFGPVDDNPLQIDMDNEHDTTDVAAMPTEASVVSATMASPIGIERRRPQQQQPEELVVGVSSGSARSGDTDRRASSLADKSAAITLKQSGSSCSGPAETKAGREEAAASSGRQPSAETASKRGAGNSSGTSATAVAATVPATATTGSSHKASKAAAAASGVAGAKLACAAATGSDAAAPAKLAPAPTAKKSSAAKRTRVESDVRTPVAGGKPDPGRSTGSDNTSDSAERHPKRKRKPSSGSATPSPAVQPPPQPSSAVHHQPMLHDETSGIAVCAGEAADGAGIPGTIQFSEDDLDLVLDQVENLDAAPALSAAIGSSAAAPTGSATAVGASPATASRGCAARPYSALPPPASSAKRSIGTEACLAAVDAEIGPVFSLGRPPSTSSVHENAAGREPAQRFSAASAAAAAALPETAAFKAAEMPDIGSQKVSTGDIAAGGVMRTAAAEQPKLSRDSSSSRAAMPATMAMASPDPVFGASSNARHESALGPLPAQHLPGSFLASSTSIMTSTQLPAPASASTISPSSSMKSASPEEESPYFYSTSSSVPAMGPGYDERQQRKVSLAAASDGTATAARASSSSGGSSSSAAATPCSSASTFYSSGAGGNALSHGLPPPAARYSPSQAVGCRASGSTADPSSASSATGKPQQHSFAVPFPPSPKEGVQQQAPQQRLHHHNPVAATGLGSASQHASSQQHQRQPSDIGRGAYMNDSSAGQPAAAVACRTGTPDGPVLQGRHAGLSDTSRDSRRSRPGGSEEQPPAVSAVTRAVTSTPPSIGVRLGDVRTAVGARGEQMQDPGGSSGVAAPASPFGSREFVPSAVASSDPFKASANVSMRSNSSSFDPGSVGGSSAELQYGRSGSSAAGSLAPPRNGSTGGGGGSGRDVDFSAEALLSPSYPLTRFAPSAAHMPVCSAAPGGAAAMFLPPGNATDHMGAKAHGHSMAAYDLLHTTSQRLASIPTSAAGQGFSAVLSKQVNPVSSSSGANPAFGGKDGIASAASSGAVQGKEVAPFNVNFFSASGSDYGGSDHGRSSGTSSGVGGTSASGARSAPSALSPFMYGTAGSMGDVPRLPETGFTFSLTATTNSSIAAVSSASQAATFGSQLAHRQFFFPMPDSLLHHSRSDDLFRPSAAAAAYQHHQLHSPGEKAQQSSPKQQQQRATPVDLGSGGAKLSHSAVNLYSSFDSLMPPHHDFGQPQQLHHHQQQQQSHLHHLQQQPHRRYDERDIRGIGVGMYDVARSAAPSSPATVSSGQQSSDKSRGSKAASSKQQQQHDKPHHVQQKKSRYEAVDPYDLAAATSRAGSSGVSASPSSMASSSPSPLFYSVAGSMTAAPSVLARQEAPAYVPFPHPLGTIRTEASSLPQQSTAARSVGTAPADLFGSLYGSPARPSAAATSGLGLPFAAAAAAAFSSSVRPPVAAASPSSSSSMSAAGGALVPTVHPSTAGLQMHSQFNLSSLFGEAMVGSQAGTLRSFPHGLLPPPPPQDGSPLYAARSAMLPHGAMSLNSLLGHHGHALDPVGSSGGSGSIASGGGGHALGPSMPSFAGHPHPMMGFGLPAPSLNFTMPDH